MSFEWSTSGSLFHCRTCGCEITLEDHRRWALCSDCEADRIIAESERRGETWPTSPR